ncbi:aminomethyl-transferring glycine dehydrogenase subunit GcvPA [Inmirania thermothiophila]|uniref:Probable glycine dehydrogenase (decarboxylating) subunit 1 n=1 Tax=Inmirania thermothiophila TaxID=1750597 RepID=A0A3N1YB76_9GAMM|nr:aminomethyl-transferring glycine dehydrogenase subunit GcvPA [Inmirania thermothiophila]ROR34647.1 glycine dehydrogenase (decarboxylating) alpha subunit [Inmirania thermothiophila]
MPFIPHTEDDVRAMLAAIGVDSVEALFEEVPPQLRSRVGERMPAAVPEMEVARIMHRRAAADGLPVCFAGAGAYDHHVPAAVWELATRGEFYTAYTPYQAEASQGTLQLIYEYQTMMARLTALEVSNASLYDGASALAEAVLMAVRANRRAGGRRVLMPRTVHPAYRATVRTIVSPQGIEVAELPFDPATGVTDPAAVEGPVAAVVIPQPNYFGRLEEVDALTDRAHAAGALAVAVVNPLSLGLLKPPGAWGADGVDIACGEGQPLGVPLSSGGPYFGFLCCRREHVRQMPGRLVGRTVDRDGCVGFTLTLQAREQHIRRSKATSNICTNQGLMVTAATIHMALLGPEGLARTAAACHANTARLAAALTAVEGVERLMEGPFFHEVVLRLPLPAREVLDTLATYDLVGGVALAGDYPELGEGALLVCATEKRTEEEIGRYAEHLGRILARRAPPCERLRPR